MYPHEHFSLWTDKCNIDLLRVCYDKTEFDIMENQELRRKIIKTTYLCSWRYKHIRLAEKHQTKYVEIILIACNPMKYLMKGEFLMCTNCMVNKSRPYLRPEPVVRFLKSNPAGFYFTNTTHENAMRHIGFDVRLLYTGTNVRQLIANDRYHLLISNYSDEPQSDVRARTEHLNTIHPRYQIDSTLFDMIYINQYLILT